MKRTVKVTRCGSSLLGRCTFVTSPSINIIQILTHCPYDLSTEVNVFGCLKRTELLPGGASVPVTEENKEVRAWFRTSFLLFLLISISIYCLFRRPSLAHPPLCNCAGQGYVQLLMELKMSRSIRSQVSAFLQGLCTFVPRKLLW